MVSTDAASLSSSAAASRFRLSSGYSAAFERRQSAVCSKSSLSASLISSSVILWLRQVLNQKERLAEGRLRHLR